MKVGDLVCLSARQTRKGLAYEGKVGLIIKVEHLIDLAVPPIAGDLSSASVLLYTVRFGTTDITLSGEALHLISENKP